MSDIDPFADSKALASALRAKLGVSAGYASDLAAGKRQPSLSMAVRIEEELGIAPAAWIGRDAHEAANGPSIQGEAA